MARVGVPPDDWAERLHQVAVASGIRVTGIQTHLARADEPDEPATDRQVDALDRFLDQAAKVGIRPALVHASNSAGALLHERARRTMVRPGIGIYGLSPDLAVDALDHGLRPALRLVSEVGFAKFVPADTPVSYGHRWSTPHAGWIATVPIGYADGVPRALSNRVEVLIGGRRRGIVGRVCMDQTLVWCDDAEPQVGDPVVLIGAQGDDRIRVEEWAAAADTITYEIVTQLTARLPRHHVG
jgi:alanine racemase